MNIPLTKSATCLAKCIPYAVVRRHYILAKGLYRFVQKDCPDHREEVSFCRPVFRAGYGNGTLTVPCELASYYHGYN